MSSSYFDLTGKVALVTGGSRGQGYQLVKAFAAHGADVFVTSRKLDACDKAAAEVRAMGRKAATHVCNVANWQELNGLVEAAYAAFGKVDILVNNAGSSPLAPSPLETSEQLFDRIVSLNFKAPFRLMSLVGSRMALGDGGSIISVSSAGGRSGRGRRSRPMPVPRPHSTSSPRPLPSSTGRRCASMLMSAPAESYKASHVPQHKRSAHNLQSDLVQ